MSNRDTALFIHLFQNPCFNIELQGRLSYDGILISIAYSGHITEAVDQSGYPTYIRGDANGYPRIKSPEPIEITNRVEALIPWSDLRIWQSDYSIKSNRGFPINGRGSEYVPTHLILRISSESGLVFGINTPSRHFTEAGAWGWSNFLYQLIQVKNIPRKSKGEIFGIIRNSNIGSYKDLLEALIEEDELSYMQSFGNTDKPDPSAHLSQMAVLLQEQAQATKEIVSRASSSADLQVENLKLQHELALARLNAEYKNIIENLTVDAEIQMASVRESLESEYARKIREQDERMAAMLEEQARSQSLSLRKGLRDVKQRIREVARTGLQSAGEVATNMHESTALVRVESPENAAHPYSVLSRVKDRAIGAAAEITLATLPHIARMLGLGQ